MDEDAKQVDIAVLALAEWERWRRENPHSLVTGEGLGIVAERVRRALAASQKAPGPGWSLKVPPA